jgi:hypothetical protein
MDMQGALRARLLAALPVTALVEQRVYWVDRPQASALPAITLQVIADGRPQDMEDFVSTRETTVQVDCWATSYAKKTELAEAVIAALAPKTTLNGVTFLRSLVDSVRDLGESLDTQFSHRTSIDLIVWHHPA